MANNGYSSINILLLTLCYLSALFLVHKIVYQLIRSHLVAFFKIWALLVAFSVHYLNTLGSPINLLIDKSFNSHQEYTIATSPAISARGTTRLCKLLILKILYKVLFLLSPKFGHHLVTFRAK